MSLCDSARSAILRAQCVYCTRSHYVLQSEVQSHPRKLSILQTVPNPACGLSSRHGPKECSGVRDLRIVHILFMHQVRNDSSVMYLPLRPEFLNQFE